MTQSGPLASDFAVTPSTTLTRQARTYVVGLSIDGVPETQGAITELPPNWLDSLPISCWLLAGRIQHDARDIDKLPAFPAAAK